MSSNSFIHVQLSIDFPITHALMRTLLKQSFSHLFHPGPQSLSLHTWGLSVDTLSKDTFLNRCPRGSLYHRESLPLKLKLLMYVLNTFRGHIKLQKDFSEVWRSNIDIMIHADENKIILMNSLLFGRCHFFDIFQGKVFGLSF